MWSTQCLPCPRSQDVVQCISLHQGCRQPAWCPADKLTALWGLTVKAQCLSACLPPGTPTASGSVADQGWLAYAAASSPQPNIWQTEKGWQREGQWCQGQFSNHFLQCSIKSSTLSLTNKLANIQQGHCDQHNVCHAPGARTLKWHSLASLDALARRDQMLFSIDYVHMFEGLVSGNEFLKDILLQLGRHLLVVHLVQEGEWGGERWMWTLMYIEWVLGILGLKLISETHF